MCIGLISGLIKFYYSQSEWEQVTDVVWYFIYFLQICSGVLLGYAILKIKKFMSQDRSTAVNYKVMSLHACAFGLYLVSVVVNCIMIFQMGKAKTIKS